MRTKLFLAFIFIILLSFISNVIFERLIINDFEDYLSGREEDSIYWILASVEGSYRYGKWDRSKLGESIHWGLMLGFESYVEDIRGQQVLSSADILFSMDSAMRKRMDSFLKLPSGSGDFSWYPLYVEGNEIGKLYLRPLEKKGLTPVKEEIFRRRGKEFLIISFLIVGGGSLILAALFTILISTPLRKLMLSAEKIASGDFSVHEPVPHRRFKDEIDKLTDSFNYMAEALRREDALRKHLTSNIAHELRTPLTVIKGNIEAIEDGVVSDTAAVTKNIREEIDRIIDLVEGIEDITRAEASFFKKGSSEEIDLKEFVESVAGGMKKIIEEKGLYIKIEGPSMNVETYPDKLHIILKNLLSNSYKFTRRGGIELTWGHRHSEDGKGYYIAVEDTGIGVSRENKEKIFERFYKDEKSSGKGLGLSIVKELTEVMGGRIKVESKEDRGTKIEIEF